MRIFQPMGRLAVLSFWTMMTKQVQVLGPDATVAESGPSWQGCSGRHNLTNA